MTPNLATTSGQVGLLSAWHARRRADLRTHVDHYGPLALPLSPDRVFAQWLTGLLSASGLTGRGGGAFPAAAKIDRVRSSGRPTSLVVNAMESEPASDKAAVLLECAPHLVIDGAEMVAAALGTRRIVVCVPDAREQTANAVALAITERACLGSDVQFEMARPPDRYVSGEESALVSWLAGGAGLPTFRADKSQPLRIGRFASLVHNPETLAHVALIARYGPEWFRSRGTEDTPGTCLVTVSGCVEHGGVYEVAMGTPLESIIDLANPSGAVRAVLVGGYGGTWLSREDLDTPAVARRTGRCGTSIGAGVLAVLDDSVCGITESARIATYLGAESARQCGPCVFGLPAIAQDLVRIARGSTDPDLLDRLNRRLEAVEGRGACSHPDAAVRMARSALSVFSGDIASHAVGRPCAHRNSHSVLRFPVRREPR